MPLAVDVTWFPGHAGRAGRFPLHEAATAADLLTMLGVAPDTALVVRGDVPIPLDARLADGDAIRIVQTMSGG